MRSLMLLALTACSGDVLMTGSVTITNQSGWDLVVSPVVAQDSSVPEWSYSLGEVPIASGLTYTTDYDAILVPDGDPFVFVGVGVDVDLDNWQASSSGTTGEFVDLSVLFTPDDCCF